MAFAADSISLGDVVETCVRWDQNWSLLPDVGLLTCIIPGYFTHFCKYPQFPMFLGKMSTRNKYIRFIKEISFVLGHRAGGLSWSTVYGEIVPILFDLVYDHLANKAGPYVTKAVKVMLNFGINLDMMKEHLPCLVDKFWKGLFDQL